MKGLSAVSANAHAGRGILIAAACVIIFAGIKAAEEIVMPFLLAAFLATIAAPPMFWLEKRRVSQWLAITLVMSTIILVLVAVGALVAQSANAFTNKLPFYESRLNELMQTSIVMLARYDVHIDKDFLLQYLNVPMALSVAGNTLRGLSNALSNGFLILFGVIFILAEASSFPRKLRDVLTSPDQSLPHFDKFALNVNRYIGIKTTISATSALLVYVFLFFLGVDFPLLWALLAFLLNYIPTIGSIIASVPAVLLALVQLGFGHALVVIAGFVIIEMVMGNVVEPRFMGRGLGISSLVVFLSLVFWGWMLGPVGMLLSIPLTITAKIAMEANPDTAWLAHLLGPADPPEPETQPEPPEPTV